MDRNVNIHDTVVGTGHIRVNLVNVYEFDGTSENANHKHLFHDFDADDDPDKISITYNGYGETIAIWKNQEYTVQGKYGELTFTLSEGNINCHYALGEKAEVDDAFSFTFTDADGSSSNTQIDVRTKFGIDVHENELSSVVKLPEWLRGCRIIDTETSGPCGVCLAGCGR